MSLLLTRRPIVVNPELAEAIGLNEAIVLQQLHYWLKETTSGVDFGGQRWIYNTPEEWAKQFPFWSDSTIRRAFSSLKKMGVIRIESLNKKKRDMTSHYTINYENQLIKAKKVGDSCEGSPLGQNDKMDNVKMTKSIRSNCHNASGQNDTVHQVNMGGSIGSSWPNDPTENTTENTTEITTENKNLSSRNSGESPDVSKSDFLAKHPEAVVYTPSGKSWGTQEDLDCAGWIFQRIQVINPTARQPNWTEWANEVRLMRQLDGRSHRDICELFKVVNRDSFWCQNVLSPRKLREKWDELTVKLLNKPTGNNHASGDTTLRDAAFRRFIGSGIPLREPSALEQAARKAASMANVGKMSPEWAQKRWNSIWTEVEQRQGAAGEAA
ncbi:replication protein O [Edwardsiella piscicida]|uniref:replication protein O n=1 Tax=Edwardsiella piscicida TaxID=1263550 RepID=UPI00084C48CD|nr:replication protein O [Edwardsiella piscicida]AOP43684.1 replication protein O [Edwardsiella piscicida]EKS7812992.1 replication protein O [Edwardsiella piscicida]UCQ20195.1 replication protein O [Edwardsiella piscicida]UCQ56603.1 replication protein O [Edwardsiella piscicida]